MRRRVVCRDEDYPEIVDDGTTHDPRFERLVAAIDKWMDGPTVEFGWLLDGSVCRSVVARERGWVVEFTATPGASVARVRPPGGKGVRRSCLSPTSARLWAEKKAIEMGFCG
jgi:hypothetical protein